MGFLNLILDVTLSPQTHVIKQKQGSEPTNQQIVSIKDPRVTILGLGVLYSLYSNHPMLPLKAKTAIDNT